MPLPDHKPPDKLDADPTPQRQVPLATHQIPVELTHPRPIHPTPHDRQWHPVTQPPSLSTSQARWVNRNARLLSPHLPVLNLLQCVLVAGPVQSMTKPPAHAHAIQQPLYLPNQQWRWLAIHSRYAPAHLPEWYQCRETRLSEPMHASDPTKR